MKRFTRLLAAILSSRRFYWLVLGFFVLEALWFVFSAAYPMAFDEDTHFGIIRIYAHQWSPFLTAQPAGADQFGPLASDPSYLYHYAMSFPYRLLELITHSQAAQVIVLRLLNVGLFTGGLVLFRRVLQRAGVSEALTNTSLMLVALVPIAPMLAAHINYDNLLMLTVATICWLTLRVMERLRQREVPLLLLGWLAVVVVASTLVKYAALPIALGTVVFVGGYAIRCFRGRGRQFWPACRRALTAISVPMRIVVVLLLLTASVLFLQRYAVNMVRYHSLVPECDTVLDEQRCQAYGPWARNHQLARDGGDLDRHLVPYMVSWQHDMRLRLFFALAGPAQDYATQMPLPIPINTATLVGLLSIGVLIVYGRRIFRGQPALVFFAIISGLYIVALFLSNYGDYLYTGQPVAINGRYLLPIMLLLMAMVGRAWGLALAERPAVKVWLASAVIVLFLQGGGVMTFILRSDPSWDWPNRAVIDVNNAARKVLAPVVIEGGNFL